MPSNSKPESTQLLPEEHDATLANSVHPKLADLERILNWGTYEERLTALVTLREWGASARPARQAILAALGDEDELVAYKAFQTLSSLFTLDAVDLNSLANADRQLRLAAIERVGMYLDESVRPESSQTDATQHGKDAPVQQTRTDIQDPCIRGKWIAWDDHHESVIAFADDYPKLMDTIRSLGLSDPDIERAPNFDSRPGEAALPLLESESADILHDIHETFSNPDGWLDSPNARLGYDCPRELIGTPREWQLRYVLRGFWTGITT